MNDEIKEILDILKDNIYVPLEDNREYKLLDKGDDKLLLDYITNLQSRIEKAVEITQNLLNTENSGYYKIIFQKQLDTLNGRSDE